MTAPEGVVDQKRTFLSKAISAGLECGTMSPDDLLAQANAEVLANHLPKEQSAKLLAASLSAKKMDAALVVETLGVEALAEHLPLPVLWKCVAVAAERALGAEAPPAKEVPGKAPGAAASTPAPVAASKARGSDKAPAPKPNVSKSTAAGSGRAGSHYRRRTRGPQSDFDVDTDVGEDWPANPVAEADALGASPAGLDDPDLTDWPQEETRNVDISSGPKR